MGSCTLHANGFEVEMWVLSRQGSAALTRLRSDADT
jgi:hypothetical protein